MKYRIVTMCDLGGSVQQNSLEFEVQYFVQAQATFAMLAVRPDVTSCMLYADLSLLCTKDEFIAAQRDRQRQAMLNPGPPPNFRM